MKSFTLVLFLAVVLLPFSSEAQEIRPVGKMYDYCQTINSIDLAGDLVVLGTVLTGMRIVDVSDPAHPDVLVSHYPNEIVSFDNWGSVAVDGDLAYISKGKLGFDIVDISSPDEIQLIGSYDAEQNQDHFWSGSRIIVNDGLAFVIDVQCLIVCDVSNPAEPQKLMESVLGDDMFNDLVTYGDYAYFGETWWGNFNILDFSDPENPSYVENNVDRYLAMASFYHIYDDKLFGGFRDGLMVADLSDPESPERIEDIQLPDDVDGFLTGIDFYENTMYSLIISENLTTTILIADVEDYANPEFVATLDIDEYVRVMEIRGQLMFLGTSSGDLIINDLSNPVDPQLVSTAGHGTQIKGISLSNNIATLECGMDGFKLLNVSNRAEPVEIMSYDTPGDVYRAVKRDNLVYILDGPVDAITQDRQGQGFRVVDVSDPARPNLLSTYILENSRRYPTDMAIYDNHAFIAHSTDGIRILDIADPRNPQEVRYIDAIVNNLEVADGLLYAVGGSDLIIFDISNPRIPQRIYYLQQTGEHQNCVSVGENLIAIAYGTREDAEAPGGIAVYAVQDPPERIEFEQPAVDVVHRVEIFDDYVFVAAGEDGLYVWDFSDRENPEIVSHYDSPWDVLDVAVTPENFVYISDWTNLGILLWGEEGVDGQRQLMPAEFTISAAYPNPFNNRTTIEFTLPQQSYVNLSVYGLNGRIVENLYKGISPAGKHIIDWNAAYYASGSYFVRLNDGLNNTQTVIIEMIK